MGDLFNILTTKKKFNASDIKFGGKYRYIARGESNNGIKGYIDENPMYLNDANTISFGQDTATMFYQNEPYFTGDKIKVLKPKPKTYLNKNSAQVIIAAMKKAFASFSWGSSSYNVSILKNIKIKLPITAEGTPDYAFMERFIAELEAERTAELEAERTAELEAYLKATGLKDTHLTPEEQATLAQLETVQWGEFRLGDILVWQKNISELNPLYLKDLSTSKDGKYPFYGQATINNGIIKYCHLQDSVLNNKKGKPTILIHSNNQNIIYLETPFYLKDGHGATSVLQSDNLNRFTAHFLISAIRKVITQKYSYNAKATKIELKNTVIKLPITAEGTPDYTFMENFIHALQKVVIADVVNYTDQKIQAHKTIIDKIHPL